MAGVIGRDNKTVTITEKDGDYCLGEILEPDEMELTYMRDGSPYRIAVDFLKKEYDGLRRWSRKPLVESFTIENCRFPL
jgi:hypothetical protein